MTTYPPVTQYVRSISPSTDSDGILLSPSLGPSRSPSPQTPILLSPQSDVVPIPTGTVKTPDNAPSGTFPPHFWIPPPSASDASQKSNIPSPPIVCSLRVPSPPTPAVPPATVAPLLIPPIPSQSSSRTQSRTPPLRRRVNPTTVPPPVPIYPGSAFSPSWPPPPPTGWHAMGALSPPPIDYSTGWAAPPLNPPRGGGSLWGAVPPMFGVINNNSEKYFFSDGNVAFRVKNTIYKVHSHFFQQSPVLAARIPSYPVPYPESSPIYIEDVTVRAFELLLSIFYPKEYTRYEIETAYDWATLLSVAKTFSMQKIRDLAIDRLALIATPAEKVELANDYNIEDWLVPAYTDLCLKLEPLSIEDGYKLGVEGVVKLQEMQHEIKSNLVKYLDMKKVQEMVETSIQDL